MLDFVNMLFSFASVQFLAGLFAGVFIGNLSVIVWYVKDSVRDLDRLYSEIQKLDKDIEILNKDFANTLKATLQGCKNV